MRKWLVVLLSVAMVASLSACGEKKVESKKESKKSNVATSNNAGKLEYISDGDAVTDASVFGENTYVFSPEDDIKDVQSKVDEIYKNQEANQFGDERYSIMFLPGEYDKSLKVNVGYYTQVSGLGVSPEDTNIRGLWVNADWMWHNATCNFWRGAENFTIDGYCMWANSQAVSLRRLNSHNGAVLSDGEGWSSGGFIADSKFEGMVSSGSQQQYLFRNDDWKYFENGVWNMVFTGVNVNKIPMGSWPWAPYTRVEKTPIIQEKPYLCYDGDHGYGVVLPESRKDCQGISWEDGVNGKFYSLNTFYIADPKKDTADTINEAIKDGKNLLLTPGIYSLDQEIQVTNPDTIVYGMGLATLEAAEGNACMKIADVDGVKVCGLLFDAGEKESETLLEIGETGCEEDHSENPSVFSDVYFRVGGGKYAGKVKSCVIVNSNNVIGDNFWVWRADHSTNVGWDMNTAPNGIIINGDNVTMYGLFVEHFQEYQTIWNGNGGRLYFYQSEMPYDAPDQKSYMSHDGKKKGYASFKIDDKVTDFEGYGLGIYCYNRDAEVEIDCGAEVPDTDGVKIHNVCTVKLNGKGKINHVINESGEPTERGGNACRVMEYENGMKEEN
ncbi:MAG: glycoside hydrolase family 55 protein [Eubacterium sp.]|nr:glycoside hydrolase family 55 protein [Eubacterium sp.]